MKSLIKLYHWLKDKFKITEEHNEAVNKIEEDLYDPHGFYR